MRGEGGHAASAASTDGSSSVGSLDRERFLEGEVVRARADPKLIGSALDLPRLRAIVPILQVGNTQRERELERLAGIDRPPVEAFELLGGPAWASRARVRHRGLDLDDAVLRHAAAGDDDVFVLEGRVAETVAEGKERLLPCVLEVT